MTRQVVVFGPGRSGTSAMMGALHQLGVYAGSVFMPAMPPRSNPRGTWEDAAFLTMNRLWMEGGISANVRNVYYAEFVAKRDAEHPVIWGVKEPRLTQSLEHLLPFLNDPRVIMMQRPKQDTVNSYLATGWGDLERAQEWYEMHERGLARQLAVYGGPLLRIRFADLMDDTRATVIKAAAFCFDGLKPPGDVEINRACDFILPSLANRWKGTQGAKVCISMPTKGTLRMEAADWRVKQMISLRPNVMLDSVVTSMPLMHARNQQVIQFLRTDCTHLFMHDSDCVPQDGTIERLLSHDKDVVSAPHPARKDDSVILVVVDPGDGNDGYRVHLPIRGMQGPAVRVGCGGMLIKRRVLEALGPPWFQFVYDDKGLIANGEDFDFCERAIAAGFEVWADCDVPQRHWAGEWL